MTLVLGLVLGYWVIGVIWSLVAGGLGLWYMDYVHKDDSGLSREDEEFLNYCLTVITWPLGLSVLLYAVWRRVR